MKRGIFTSVVLSAFAVGFVSNAHAAFAPSTPSWFDAGIESYDSWPSDGTDKIIENEGTWSGTTNATYDTEHSALVVNADGDNKLPPAISHRNTRCVDRAGKYFLEYAA